jgi:hypothetical protein
MRRMNSIVAVLVVCLSVMVAGLSPVSAQTAPAPRIFSVVSDLAGTTLVVSGMRFGEGPEVWVNGETVPVLPGASDERLEIDVPSTLRARPGTYRLIVRTSAGRTDSFEVMVGGTGVLGATGADAGGCATGPSIGAGSAAGPGADAAKRAGAATPGGTRPGTPPSLVEDTGWPFATKVGYQALFSNTTGGNNTAAGAYALRFNTSGFENTAVGASALAANVTGSNNTATGTGALWSNTTGTNNTATADAALYLNTTGSYNTATGFAALLTNMTGSNNTAIGSLALQGNTTGTDNVALGFRAGRYETGSNAFYIDNQDRTNTAGDKAGALLYGTFNGTPASQTLRVNGALSTLMGATVQGLTVGLGSNAVAGNTAVGLGALQAATLSGAFNVAVGRYPLPQNTTGGKNIAIGQSAMYSNTTGSDNTAVGTLSLYGNQTGAMNTAFGEGALYTNTASSNTALGYWALYYNTTGYINTAVGKFALRGNTEGNNNAGLGYAAAVHNTTGSNNTATGYQALHSNNTGSDNVAVGYNAGYGAVDSSYANGTFVGSGAGFSNSTGGNNTALGMNALYANTTGNRNVALGYQAGNAQTTGSDNVYVANPGVAAESGTIRIGTAGTHTDTYLAGTVRATAFAGSGAGLTDVAASTASDLVCAGCVSAGEVSFNYADSASAGGPATSALTATLATTATTAADALALGGLSPSAYATSSHTHVQFGSMVLQGSTGQNTALGTGALGAVSTGTANLALGYQAGNAQTTGSDNVYIANGGIDGENGTIRIGTAGTHTDTYLAGTVRATAFVGDGAGLINVTCAGSGGSSVPPVAPDSQAVLSELPILRRIVTAQADQLAVQGTQLAAQEKRLAVQEERLAAQGRQLTTLAALQQRLAQLEVRLAPSRAGGSR